MAKNKTNTAPSTTPRGQRAPKGVLWRLLKTLFEFYPVLLPVTLVCILINAIVSSVPSVFMQNIIALVDSSYKSGDWSSVSGQILTFVGILITMYIISLIAGFCYTQLMAIITQGSLKKLREKMFDHMEDLPIRYFDTNGHGDIMSYYTNDVDTLRQMISQSLPQLVNASISFVAVLVSMIVLDIPLTVLSVAMVLVMLKVMSKLSAKAGEYFGRQQRDLGKVNGYIEEMMEGQKVVKVFCHEDKSLEQFKKLNDDLRRSAETANKIGNIMMPVNGNLGNISYVLCAIVGGVLALSGHTQLTIGTLVAFLTLNKSFTQPVTMISQQAASVVMAMAGAERVFKLLDKKPEEDEGYVELVNAVENPDGSLRETDKRTGIWAWKHPHKSDGRVSYTRLCGEVTFDGVDFGYTEDKTVLHDIKMYAKPGQKLAFVGSTGAGKTTITNLINRFYDINDGKIRYDGINIGKIKKPDLRRSLGMVLQDTCLFTGTVMENIRYGRLDATDAECIEAARLANADGFIRRLPEGYDTVLTGSGAKLSQGQRQLIAIARAAVADPPVLILDEATSSIDTRTERLVQEGMDALMDGRTSFVIAHRLSTVQNADCIMVLENGRIIERGTHDDLIAQKGRYYQLYTGNSI